MGWLAESSPLEVVYLWADGIYVKQAVLLVVLAALSDAARWWFLTSGYRESTESWSEVLRDLKRRGMNAPRLVIADGHLGIWGALYVYPEAEEQRCWNQHRQYAGQGAQTRAAHGLIDSSPDPLC